MTRTAPQIHLVSLSPDHAKFIYEHNQGNVKTYFKDFQSVAEVQIWIRRQLCLPHIHEWIAVYDKQPIGGIGIYPQPNPGIPKESHIGLWVSPEHQGKGFGKAMVNALIRIVQNKITGTQLYYCCAKDNIGSKRIAEQTGFAFLEEKEGALRYVYRYS